VSERNARPDEGGSAEKAAEGAASGNEKLQDEGQRGAGITQEREDDTFIGGKDRQPPSTSKGSKEGHVVETGMPADLVDEDKIASRERVIAEQAKAVDKLKADAEERKPLKEPETERTEQDSRRTNLEVAAQPPVQGYAEHGYTRKEHDEGGDPV